VLYRIYKIQIYKKNWQEIFGLGSLLPGRKFFIKAVAANKKVVAANKN
jgi:hypothetical protein